VDRQAEICRRLLETIGYDFDGGRLDVSAHPFTESMGLGDVRVTTAYHEDDLLSGITSTLHEGGHALYEQGLPEAHHEAPAGQSASLGWHESQSRLWENHVGRGLPFCRWLAPQLAAAFPEQLADLTAEALYRAANVIRPTPIRIEADEITYNLHIVLRFEIERALFAGELEPAGVPEAWRERARDDLGLELADERQGALQDIHWCVGGFGYFPTYTLGNLYAAMLWQAARSELPDLDRQLAVGETGSLLSWLRAKVHRRGAILTARDLCREATGGELSSEAFVAYLAAKHEALNA
jgi:carboxypeptidase Taq